MKDIIILIDCNCCNKMVIDSYIDVTKTILKNYLKNNDRLGVFFLLSEYKIICSLMRKEEIDIINFYKDLDIFSEKLFKKEYIEYSSVINEEIQEKMNIESLDFIDELKQNPFNDSSSGTSNDNSEFKNKRNKRSIKIEDKMKSINYCLTYLKMKEIRTNEKFFIYFSSDVEEYMKYLLEIENNYYIQNLSYESKQINKIYLRKEKTINFLLVGKLNKKKKKNINLLYLNISEKKVI